MYTTAGPPPQAHPFREVNPPMCFEAEEAVRRLALPSGEKFVLWAIAYHVNKDSGEWALSVRELMGDTGQSRPAVLRHLATLEQAGHLTVTRANGKKSSYRVAAYTPDPSHHDTGITMIPVSPRHPHPYHHDTPPVSPRYRSTSIDRNRPEDDDTAHVRDAPAHEAALRAWESSPHGKGWLYVNPGRFRAGKPIALAALRQQAQAWAQEYPDLAADLRAALRANAPPPPPPAPRPLPRPPTRVRAARAAAVVAATR